MDFYRRVGIVLRAVPEGRVVSYGQVALLCGCLLYTSDAADE